MPTLSLPRHDELTATSRLAGWGLDGTPSAARDWLLLGLAGVVAATSSTWLDFSLKIPGHAILRAVFPMALGLALVPRKGAGLAMGASAGVTALLLRFASATGHGPGLGALTSLLATGPLLDVALWRARAGWRLWLGFAAAGLGANLLAFLVRGASKKLATPTSLTGWLQTAPVTYALCGLAAGLFSGMIWFAYRRRAPGPAA